MDIVFCGNNCGDGENCAGHCASGTCLSKTDGMIMGANAYEHVLTIGGCDTNDALVGYSSRGPSIPNMYEYKPDLVAYTHFLGSRVSRVFVPDTGVSAACPVAAGCVAALRSHADLKPSKVSSEDLFNALRNTARKPPGMPTGWDPGYGHGIIDPVAAARSLGVTIP
jgi:subtilisin family serine protease